MAAGNVDDAEAAHPHREVAVAEIAEVIRPAMHDRVALRGDDFDRNRSTVSSVPSGNAAHVGVIMHGLIAPV